MSDTRKVIVRQENGHQVIVLPHGVRIEGEEVVVQRDEETGALRISTQTPQQSWQDLFAAIDAHGPISDQDWDAFTDRIQGYRLSRSEDNRDIFSDPDIE